jgi:hypothetical protein
MVALFSLAAGVFISVAGILALIFGGNREKTAALLCLCGLGINLIWTSQWEQPIPIPYLVTDMAVLGGLVSLCWKAPRSWPLWVSGLKLLSVMAAVTILRNPELTGQTFLVLWWGLSVSVMVAIIVGTVQSLKFRPKQAIGQNSDL